MKSCLLGLAMCACVRACSMVWVAAGMSPAGLRRCRGVGVPVHTRKQACPLCNVSLSQIQLDTGLPCAAVYWPSRCLESWPISTMLTTLKSHRHGKRERHCSISTARWQQMGHWVLLLMSVTYWNMSEAAKGSDGSVDAGMGTPSCVPIRDARFVPISCTQIYAC